MIDAKFSMVNLGFGEEKNYNSKIISTHGIRAIAYNPLLAKIGGSATAGLFLSQLLYWWDKGRNRQEIYKSARQIKEETALTTANQNSAIKIWSKLSVLKVQVKGLPPTKFFEINTNNLTKLILNYVKNNKHRQEVRNLFTEEGQRINKMIEDTTESTQETDQEKPPEIIQKSWQERASNHKKSLLINGKTPVWHNK